MKSSLVTLSLTVVALLLVAPAFAQADPTLPEDATGETSRPASVTQASQLVQVMRLDELSAELMKQSIRGPGSAGLSEAQRECAEGVKPTAFTAGLANIIAGELTRDELAATLDFFQSATGRKTIAATFENLGVQRVPGASAPAPDLDDTELTTEFERTSAGRKVLGSHLFTRSEHGQELMQRTLNETLAACRAGS